MEIRQAIVGARRQIFWEAQAEDLTTVVGTRVDRFSMINQVTLLSQLLSPKMKMTTKVQAQSWNQRNLRRSFATKQCQPENFLKKSFY